jgi:hypothetical protein
VSDCVCLDPQSSRKQAAGPKIPPRALIPESGQRSESSVAGQ